MKPIYRTILLACALTSPVLADDVAMPDPALYQQAWEDAGMCPTPTSWVEIDRSEDGTRVDVAPMCGDARGKRDPRTWFCVTIETDAGPTRACRFVWE